MGYIDDKLEVDTEGELVFVSRYHFFIFFSRCFIFLSGDVYE